MSFGRIATAVVGAASALASCVGAPVPGVVVAYERASADLRGALDSGHMRRKDLLLAQILYSDLSATDRNVANAILHHYNHTRQDAFPGYQRIADLAKCHRRTAIRAVHRLADAGFITIEHRWRIEDRWPGRERADRTNVYRFVDGAVVAQGLEQAADEAELLLASWEAQRDEALGLSSAEPSPWNLPARPSAPSAPAKPEKPAAKPGAKPAEKPARPAEDTDERWALFAEAFALEHRAQYGAGSEPGIVSAPDLRQRAVNTWWDYVSECDAWAASRGHAVDRLEVARDLARRMARIWIARPGRDGRVRDAKHPIGWIVRDLGGLGSKAVDGWKQAQRRRTGGAPSPDSPPTSSLQEPGGWHPASRLACPPGCQHPAHERRDPPAEAPASAQPSRLTVPAPEPAPVLPPRGFATIFELVKNGLSYDDAAARVAASIDGAPASAATCAREEPPPE